MGVRRTVLRYIYKKPVTRYVRVRKYNYRYKRYYYTRRSVRTYVNISNAAASAAGGVVAAIILGVICYLCSCCACVWFFMKAAQGGDSQVVVVQGGAGQHSAPSPKQNQDS